jgi:hypothetical protein
MAAAIIIEDGTGVNDANSYATTDQVRDYCALRGYTLSDDDSLLMPYMIAAMDYLEAIGNNYIGTSVFLDGLQWPRYITNCGGWSSFFATITSATIPKKLIQAQCQLVVEQLKGITILVSAAGSGGAAMTFPSPLEDGTEIDAVDGRFAKRERLEGVSDDEYSETVGVGLIPYLPSVDALLSNLVVSNATQLTVSRG